MRVLSLFDGISCGMVALQRAGFNVSDYIAYEIDKYAIQVSQKNYPQIEHCGDVFGGDFRKYQGFDLLIGGSPCTFWSIAKNNREITPDGIEGLVVFCSKNSRAAKYCEKKHIEYRSPDEFAKF